MALPLTPSPYIHSIYPQGVSQPMLSIKLLGSHQREGMGLLEYQAMPSLSDVTHDGHGCVHLLYVFSWKFQQLVAAQLRSGQPIRYGKGRWYGSSSTYKITPAVSFSSSQPGEPPFWTSPLAFGLIGSNTRPVIVSMEGWLGSHAILVVNSD